MFYYTAYNLRIESELNLPELHARVSSLSAPDAIFRFGSVKLPPHDAATDQPHRWEYEQAVCISRPQVGAFAVHRNGREIVIDPHTRVDESALRLMLLGPALALLLHLRNLFVLHASAVRMLGEDSAGESCGAAFLGHSGEGKSTLAAALLHHPGYDFVADDLVAVDLSGVRPRMFSGYPQLKLYPAAARAALGEDWDDLPRVHADFTKRSRILEREFDSSTLTLKRIYVLAYGDTERVEILSPHEAVIELIRHTYGARYAYSAAAEKHLARCAQLAAQAMPRRLVRRRDLTRLNHLIEAIRRDLDCLDMTP